MGSQATLNAKLVPKLASADSVSGSASVADLEAPSATGLGESLPRRSTHSARVENGQLKFKIIEQTESVEGGLWAWTTVIGALLMQFCGFGYVNAFGVYEDFYVREYLPSYSSSQISWIGSVQIFFTMTSGLFVGRLFDRGYFVHMVISGSALITFALFMLSLAKPDKFYQIFLSQGVILGLGSGLIFVPTLSVISHHFCSPGSRAFAMGLVATGSSLGGLLHPIMLNNLLHGERAIGFGSSVRASAFMILGLEIIALGLVRTRYGNTRGIGKLWNKSGATHMIPSGVSNTDLKQLLRKLFTDWKYVFMLGSMLVYSMGLFFPIFYVQLNALLHGLDPTFAFYSVSILNGSSIIGRLLPGFLARRFNFAIMDMVLFCNFSGAILIFSMLGVKTVAGVVVFAVLYGMSSGGLISLLGPRMALMSDHPSELGLRMGIAFSCTGVGALVGNPINGALLTELFIWWRPTLFSGVLCLTGTVLTAKSNLLYYREKGRGSR